MGNPENKEVPNITISSCGRSNATPSPFFHLEAKDEIATSLRSSQ
jgi:hypothetical protein